MLQFDARAARRAADARANRAKRANPMPATPEFSTISTFSTRTLAVVGGCDRSVITNFDARSQRMAADLAAMRRRGRSEEDGDFIARLADWSSRLDALADRLGDHPFVRSWLADGLRLIESGWALQALRLGWSELSLWAAPLGALFEDAEAEGASRGLALRLCGKSVRLLDAAGVFVAGGDARIPRPMIVPSPSVTLLWKV